MGIGTSDGKYYDDETDYVFDQFSKGQQQNFETKLSKEEEGQYQDWKSIHAPNDSGFDYDFRGAFKAGVTPDNESNHWPDTFKKPNHPTFSDQSQYAKDAPHLAGSWNEDTYIPPANIDALIAAAPNFANSSVIDQMSATAERSRPGDSFESVVNKAKKDTPSFTEYTGNPKELPTFTDHIMGLVKGIATGHSNQADATLATIKRVGDAIKGKQTLPEQLVDDLMSIEPLHAPLKGLGNALRLFGILGPVDKTIQKPINTDLRASAAQDVSDMSDVAARPRDPSVDSFIERYGVWNIHDKLKKDEEDERIQNEINREGKAKYLRPGTKSWPSRNTLI